MLSIRNGIGDWLFMFHFLLMPFRKVRGAFNKFPDFFVQALKLVIDSWKFTLLLLYILCDDWPIFMISGSKDSYSRNWNTLY